MGAIYGGVSRTLSSLRRRRTTIRPCPRLDRTAIYTNLSNLGTIPSSERDVPGAKLRNAQNKASIFTLCPNHLSVIIGFGYDLPVFSLRSMKFRTRLSKEGGEIAEDRNRVGIGVAHKTVPLFRAASADSNCFKARGKFRLVMRVGEFCSISSERQNNTT